MPRKAREPGRQEPLRLHKGDALETATDWLRRDPGLPEDCRVVYQQRLVIRRLVDRLIQDHSTEACELCLLLEEAFARQAGGSGLPATRGRALVKLLAALVNALRSPQRELRLWATLDAELEDEAENDALRDDGRLALALGAEEELPAPAVGTRLECLRTLSRIAGASGHSFYEAEALLREAELLLPAGYLARALRCYQRAEGVATAASLGLLTCAALGGQARLWQLLGNLFKAHSLYNRQLQLARTLGESVLVQSALSSMAATALLLGDRRRAARYAREHLLLARQEGDETGALTAQIHLGQALRRLLRLEPSQRHLEEALLNARRLGLLRLEAEASYQLACTLRAQESARAVALLEHARRLLAVARPDGAPSLSDLELLTSGSWQLLRACERALRAAERGLGAARLQAALAATPAVLAELFAGLPRG